MPWFLGRKQKFYIDPTPPCLIPATTGGLCAPVQSTNCLPHFILSLSCLTSLQETVLTSIKVAGGTTHAARPISMACGTLVACIATSSKTASSGQNMEEASTLWKLCAWWSDLLTEAETKLKPEYSLTPPSLCIFSGKTGMLEELGENSQFHIQVAKIRISFRSPDLWRVPLHTRHLYKLRYD